MDNKREIELSTIYVDGISKTPLEDEHLLISSFLKVQHENEHTMSAYTDSVKNQFKSLVHTRDGKYKKHSFKDVLEELIYTSYSLEANYNSALEPILGQFNHKTIFELLTKDGFPIDGGQIGLAIEDENNVLIRVWGPFYDILNEYKEKFDYDNCLKLCQISYEKKQKDKIDKKEKNKKIKNK